MDSRKYLNYYLNQAKTGYSNYRKFGRKGRTFFLKPLKFDTSGQLENETNCKKTSFEPFKHPAVDESAEDEQIESDGDEDESIHCDENNSISDQEESDSNTSDTESSKNGEDDDGDSECAETTSDEESESGHEDDDVEESDSSEELESNNDCKDDSIASDSTCETSSRKQNKRKIISVPTESKLRKRADIITKHESKSTFPSRKRGKFDKLF